jgi:YD repeat-containing protein
MRIARVGRGTRIILGWLLAACFALGAAHASAAEQRYVYDELGRLIAVIDPAGETTHYTYDEAGNLTSVSRASSAQISIAAFTPSRGRSGDAVSIFGTGFSATPAQNAVTFNGTPAVVTSSTTTSIVAVVPVAAASGPLRVTTPNGSATSAQAFTVVVPQPPQIAAFSPPVVAPNATVVVSGSAFEPVPAENQVRVNAATAVVIAATDETLTVRAPNATGGRITVTTPNGSIGSADDLFIVPPPNVVADVAATRRITIDAPGAVVTLPASKVGLLLFDGTAGAVGVKLSVRDVTLSSGTITVYAPNGSTLASTSFGTNGAVVSLPTLPVTGSYGVRLTGGGAAGNATVAVWRDVTGTLGFGLPVDVAITNPGQQARFTFTGAVGDNVGIDVSNVALPGSSQIFVIRDFDGFPLVNGTSFSSAGLGARIGTLSVAGTYTVIIVPGSGATGTVRLTLWKDVGGTLSAGTPQTPAVDFRNQQIRMTFQATAGQSAGIELANPAFGGQLFVIRDFDGFPLVNGTSFSASTGLSTRIGTLSVAGSYTVLILPAASATGNVRVTLWEDVERTITPGSLHDITVAFRNQQVRLHFTGAPNQFLGLQISDLTGLTNGQVFVTRDADGFPLVNGTSFTAAGLSVRIASQSVNTNYTILLTPTGGASGTGTFKLRLWTDVSDTLSVGTPYDASILYGQQQARFTFSGVPGDILGIDLSSVTLPAGSQLFVTRDSDGFPLVNGTSFSSAGLSARVVAVNVPGTYTVRIIPGSGGIGNVRVTLWRDVAGQLALGVPQQATLGFSNQQIRMTFQASAGQTLGIDLANPGFGGQLFVTRDSDGFPFVNGTSFSTGTGLSARIGTINATGSFTVLVMPAANTTGSVQLTLWSDVPGELTPGTPAPVTVAFRNQQIRMSFQATAGQNLGINIANPGFGGQLFVTRNSDGFPLVNGTSFSATTGLSARIGLISAGGGYTVLVIPAGGATGNAQLTLWSDVSGELTSGVATPVNVAFPNQQIRTTFQGTAGQTFGVDIANPGFGGQLFVTRNSDGFALINGTSFSAGSGLSARIGTISTTGAYTVLILPASGATGSAQLTLWEDFGGTLALDAQASATLPYRNQQVRMRFVGTAGQNLGLDLTEVTGFSAGQLFVTRDLDGFPLVNGTSFSAPAGVGARIGTLSTSGNYTVVVMPTANTTGSLKLRLWKDVDDTLTIGAAYPLTIAYRNQQARLPFSGTAGDQLSLELSGVTLASGGQIFVIRNLDGFPLINGTSFATGGGTFAIPQLSTTGTYTVQIVPTSSGTGTMNVRVFRP